MKNLHQHLAKQGTQGASISNEGIVFEKLKFPLKLRSSLTNRNDFEFALDSLTKTDSLLFNEKKQLSLSVENPQHFGFFDHSTEVVQEKIKEGLQELISDKFEEALNLESLGNLQENLLGAVNNFVNDDFKLSYSNNIGTNFHFNPLNGEFCEVISNVIEPGNKAFSMESRHHEAGGKVATQKYFKTTSLKGTHSLEGNSRISNQTEIENEQKKWSEILLQSSQEGIIDILAEQSLGELLSSSTAVLDILNLTNITLNKKSDEDSQNVEVQYNHLWNSFAQHFEKKEELGEKKADDEQAPPEDYLDFEKEADTTAIKAELEKLPSVEAVNYDEASEIQQVFEKGLAESLPVQSKQASKAKITSSGVSQYKWAIQDNTDLTNFYQVLPKNKFAIEYPFELDDFQKRAILHLENKESVFVAAHTSAGKTVVAEYAVALAKKHMTRAVYTSPIKALSNQKYRDFTSKFDSVGILTGDVTLKPEATCLIVTTEVLRSMLYKGSDIIKDIEWVIFDEVHYVNNAERGVVWEETIIMLPPHIGIIMLSATVPNAMEFANWVGMTKKRKIFVQTTYKRPTPLEHSIYLNGKFEVIKPKGEGFLVKNYEKLIENMEKAKKDRDDFRDKRKADLKEKFEEKGWKFKDDEKKKFFQKKQLDKVVKNQTVVNPTMTFKQQKAHEEITRYYQLIRHLQKEKLLPCVLFAFSKKKCMELAFGLSGLDLCDRTERNKISVFFNNALKRLKPVDRELPQLINLREILLKGVAVHHGDLLPIAKEVVEILFADGLVKVLFATETFAMGVNMPAKTVVFCGLKKSDGKEYRYLKSSEYTQMSGRAGRRGLDDKGNVVLFIRDFNDLPMSHDLKNIIDHKGETLESKFRLSYGIIFNLLLSREISVTDVMRRSFVEHDKVTSLPELHKKLKDKKEQQNSIRKIYKCKVKPFAEVMPIEDYASIMEGLRSIAKDLWTHNAVFPKIVFPKFARILGETGETNIGIIFASEKTASGVIFKTLMGNPKKPNYNKEDAKKIQIGYEEESKQAYGEVLNDTTFRVYDLRPSDILDIFNEKIECGKIESELKGKFKQDLTKALQDNEGRIEKVKADKEYLAFNVGGTLKNDPSVSKAYSNMKKMKSNLGEHICHSCDMKLDHLAMLNKINELEKEIKDLSKNVSEDNIAYMDQFEARIKILQELNYLDEKQNPLIKARIARELGSADIFLCEVIMENTLIDLTPEEVAAVLSSFVCQVKRTEINYNDLLPDTLLDAMENVQQICQKIHDMEIKNHITFEDEEDYLGEKINWSLVKVVYEWASQKDFSEICLLTDAQEGSIVRTILRLDILLRDLKSACKVMGNMRLHQLVDDASRLIHRDIVFAGSLYLE